MEARMGRGDIVVIIFVVIIGGDLLELRPTESADFRGAEERRRSKGVGGRSDSGSQQGQGSEFEVGHDPDVVQLP